MQWQSEGIVISAKPHGEGHLVLAAFTPDHGLHKGYVFGGSGVRKRPFLELGNLLDLKWSSRFEDQLGTFTIELVENYASVLFHDGLRLTALNVMAHLLHLLPERELHPWLYQQTRYMMAHLRNGSDWYIPFILWERDFLEAIGFGLSLKSCILSKKTVDLAYVSPRTGCVVSAKAGAQYADKLLPLPSFWKDANQAIIFDRYDFDDIKKGFALTGFFLEKVLTEHFCTALPETRHQLIGSISAHLSKE